MAQKSSLPNGAWQDDEFGGFSASWRLLPVSEGTKRCELATVCAPTFSEDLAFTDFLNCFSRHVLGNRDVDTDRPDYRGALDYWLTETGQGARNSPFCSSQDKVYTVVPKGVGNISDSLLNPLLTFLL